MKIPENLQLAIQDILSNGGKPYLVGGAVRDMVLGISPKDLDVEVFNMPIGKLSGVLAGVGPINTVGQAHGCIKMQFDDLEVDFTIPRTDNKIGVGHPDFEHVFFPDMKLPDAILRRDFTMNTLFMPLRPGVENFFDLMDSILDFRDGRGNLRDGVLVAVSEDTFGEDPLRLLRGMQFCARFNLAPSLTFIDMCKSGNLRNQLKHLPKERIYVEWYKWATKSTKPSMGLRYLLDTGITKVEPYCIIELMAGTPQDKEWHPEGWSFQFSCTSASFVTSVAQTIPMDVRDTSTFWKFFNTSLALDTIRKSPGSTFTAEPVDTSVVESFLSTVQTRNFDLLESDKLSVATITKPESFVGVFGRPTLLADKIVRVVFEIPLDGMQTIVRTSYNDLEVLNRIVERVSIDMMDMFPTLKFPTQMGLHNKPMDRNVGAATSIFIPVFIIDSRSSSINGNVLCTFDVCIVDSKVVHNRLPEVVYYKVTTSNYNTMPGNVLVHTAHVVDQAALIAEREGLTGEDRAVLLFAALCHDFGKPHTTAEENGRITSKRHSIVGVDVAYSFLTEIGMPNHMIARILPLIEEHLIHSNKSIHHNLVRRLANRMKRTHKEYPFEYNGTIKELLYLIEADASGRPPIPPGLPEECAVIGKMAKELELEVKKPEPIIMGRHLIEHFGMTPSKEFKVILTSCFEEQLDGRITTVEEGLIYLRTNVFGTQDNPTST